jgi:arylsulfatase A-like enzyme
VAERPNVLFFHVDNLGFGELSCYAGGPFRGARTERIDAFATQGFRLTNYCPESQCSPTRSALLTGRHAIRSGTHSVPVGVAGGWGLVAWEQTLGDLLRAAMGVSPTASGMSVKAPAAGPPTGASKSGVGRRGRTTRPCGRPTPGTTPNATPSPTC